LLPAAVVIAGLDTFCWSLPLDKQPAQLHSGGYPAGVFDSDAVAVAAAATSTLEPTVTEPEAEPPFGSRLVGQEADGQYQLPTSSFYTDMLPAASGLSYEGSPWQQPLQGLSDVATDPGVVAAVAASPSRDLTEQGAGEQEQQHQQHWQGQWLKPLRLLHNRAAVCSSECPDSANSVNAAAARATAAAKQGPFDADVAGAESSMGCRQQAAPASVDAAPAPWLPHLMEVSCLLARVADEVFRRCLYTACLPAAWTGPSQSGDQLSKHGFKVRIASPCKSSRQLL